MKRWIWVLIFIAAVAGVVAVLSFGGSRRKSVVDQYQTVTTVRGSIMDTVGATGTVRANQDAILTFQISGIVEKVMVASGDKVQKGDLLVTLEALSLPAQIILARADLVAAQNALEALLDTDLALANVQLALTLAQEALENSDYALLVQQEGNRASGETIAEAQANLVLVQTEVDRAQQEYSKYSGRRMIPCARLHAPILPLRARGEMQFSDNLIGTRGSSRRPIRPCSMQKSQSL